MPLSNKGRRGFLQRMLTAGGLAAVPAAQAQNTRGPATNSFLPWYTRAQNYKSLKQSSFDRTGGNRDSWPIAAGAVQEVFNAQGPGVISHIWFTIAARSNDHLKELVLRGYWDGNAKPSVEAPIGDFFGLNLNTYQIYQSDYLACSPGKSLNCYFVMPYRRSARFTVTNEGKQEVGSFYSNIDYMTVPSLPDDALYFHAQYRQSAPCVPVVAQGPKLNLDGRLNYVYLETRGRGHLMGVTLGVLQNANGWWGEGDDMFFIDGDKLPTIEGTGSEDYFMGAWDFGDQPFSYGLMGAPVKGDEVAGSHSSVYRFHLDSPIPFTKSIRATIEHGHANHRSDNYYSVAYWYQTEPHAPFPALPPVNERIPRIYPVGGPGNAGK